MILLTNTSISRSDPFNLLGMVNTWNGACYTELFSFYGREERACEKKKKWWSSTCFSDEELLKPVEWKYHCRIYTKGSVKRVVQAKATVPTATGYWWRCATPAFISHFARARIFIQCVSTHRVASGWMKVSRDTIVSLANCMHERWTVLYVAYLIQNTFVLLYVP